jgi:plastocyanin
MVRKSLITTCFVMAMLTGIFNVDVLAADTMVTVRSQVMAPAMLVDPEKVDIEIGDTVTWLNLSGQGIKINPDWEAAEDLPPYIQTGGSVRLRFDRPGTYRYSIFTATDRFKEDRVPVKISGRIIVGSSDSQR